MTFRCTYCNEDHENTARAQEHIIPERLGNKNFVHKNTCLRVNNGLSHAVEKPFVKQTTIDTILISINPPKGSKPHLRGTLTTSRGTEETLFVHKGQFVIGELPNYTPINVVPVTLQRRDGTEVEHLLKLPIDILHKITASNFMLSQEDAEKKLEVNKKLITEYLGRLKSDLSIDPDFAQFVMENDIVLRSHTVGYDVEQTQRPASLVDDLLPREYVIDLELAARYFAKIAVLFAAESGNRALLTSSEAEALRSFIPGFFVDPDTARNDDGKPHPFFSSTVVGDAPAYWWAESIAQSEVAINTTVALTPDQRRALLLANAARARTLHSVLPLFRFDKLGSIGPEFHESPRTHAYHELELVSRDGSDARPGVWCRIGLFGRHFEVDVLLSADPSASLAPIYKRIDTPWFVSKD